MTKKSRRTRAVEIIVAIVAIGATYAEVSAAGTGEHAGGEERGPPALLAERPLGRTDPVLRDRPDAAVRVLAVLRPSVPRPGLEPDVVRFIDQVPNDVKYQVTYEQRDHPSHPGHWGAYDEDRRTVFIGEQTRGRPDLQQYVVFHETAHAFYWQILSAAERALVAGSLGMPPGVIAVEGFADCVAKHWGSPPLYAYWDCPAESLEYVRGVVGG